MSARVSETRMSQLSDFLAAQVGLRFPRERWDDLEREVAAAAREFGCADVEACIAWLLSSPLSTHQIEILASYLTVGETYFFRDKKSFEALEDYILPELIRARRGTDRRLRIWSAGCSTGEEAYSIAISVRQLLPDWKDWNITILATDINPRYLRQGWEGVYKDWSFRDNPPWVQERYFTRSKEKGFEVLPELKKMVAFAYLNLVGDSYPSLWNNTNAMDVILCRNVLMYFAPEQTRPVIDKLRRSLVEGGWLLVSPSEASQVLFSEFAAVNFPGAILYRKDSGRPRSLGVFASPRDQEVPVPPPAPVPWAPEAESEMATLPEMREPLPVEPEPVEATNVEPSPCDRALVLCREGRYREAAEKLVAFLSQNGPEPKAMALLARVYANQGELSQASHWCEQAIAAERLNPAYHYLRATILQEQGGEREAQSSLRRTLYLDPDFVLAHLALGNLARRQGQARESARHWQNALSLLSRYRPEDTLPESEGITAGRLIEIIRSTAAEEITP